MDVTSIAALATDMQAAKLANAVNIEMLKKTMDIQSNSTLQLLAAIPPNPTATSGNFVNTYA